MHYLTILLNPIEWNAPGMFLTLFKELKAHVLSLVKKGAQIFKQCQSAAVLVLNKLHKF